LRQGDLLENGIGLDTIKRPRYAPSSRVGDP
jgi:hypothetical protein